MKLAVIVFAVCVLALPCVVAVFLIFTFLTQRVYAVALFLALLLTAAATIHGILDCPLARLSSRRAPAVPKPNHSQEKTHANCLNSQPGS